MVLGLDLEVIRTLVRLQDGSEETIEPSRRNTPDLDERAAVLGVIAQPMRLRLFYLLDQIGEVCVCDLGEILGITQSAVSEHLAKFKAHGLVTVRRENQTLFNRLADRPDVKLLRKLGLAGIEKE